MSINLDTLRKTAEAATPGPWDLYSTQDYEVFCAANFTDSNYDPPAVTYGSDRSEDAEFIATFNPETVLALLSRLEQAEQAVARVRELHERIPVVVNGRWEIDHCKFCYEQDFSSDDAVWPCPTIRALDGDGRLPAGDALGGGQDG